MASGSSSPLEEVLLDKESQAFLEVEHGAMEHRRENEYTKRNNATPIPKAQLATLCVVRLVDPITFTQIFPYVNEMMTHLHLTDDPSKIGFYSGVVESSFAVSQLLSIYQWARLSDMIGRRPVVLAGTTGIAISTILFGMSRTLWGVIFARCLAGLFSGNIAVVHSVLGEITDSTNQATAFPIYGLCWPLGSIIGPLLGGTFSNPAMKFPRLFGYELLRTYPYLLPCLMAAMVATCGAMFGYVFLEETLPGRRMQRQDNRCSTGDEEIHLEMTKKAVSFKYLLSIPVIRALCFSGCALSFINTAFDVTFVLFSYSPVETGGLAFSVSEIGCALAISGTVSAALQLFFMPFLLRRFDPARTYNVCMAVFPYCFLLLPGLNVIARMGLIDGSSEVNPATKALLWVGIGIILTMARAACLAFSVSMILVKENAPDPSSLGVSNGLVQFAMCFARAFSPAFASSLFALSAGFDFAPMRYLWVVVMTSISLLGTTFSRRIAEGRTGPRDRQS